MTLTAVNGSGLLIPQLLTARPTSSGIVSNSVSALIDASGEKYAVIIRVPKTGTLDKFEFRLGTVGTAPGNGIRCSFQDVSLTTGDPDGTQDEFRTVTSGLTADTWVAPGLITSDGTDGGTKRSVTRGDLLACVIEFESFTTGDSLNIATMNLSTDQQAFPYSTLFTSSWAKSRTHFGIVVLKYSDGSYDRAPSYNWAIQAFNTTTFNSTSTPDEIGIIFQFAAPVKVGGGWVAIDLDANVDIVLYDSDGSTPLETITLDTDARGTALGGTIFFPFTSDVSLSANTNYRLVVKPGTTNITIYDLEVAAAAIFDSMMGGQEFHYTSRTDAGSWSQTTTKRPLLGLFVTAMDDAAGGATFVGTNQPIIDGYPSVGTAGRIR